MLNDVELRQGCAGLGSFGRLSFCDQKTEAIAEPETAR